MPAGAAAHMHTHSSQYVTLSYLWPDGVLYPNDTDGCEVTEDAVLVVPGGFRMTGEVTERHTDGPQAITRHGLDHLLHHLILVPWTENPRLAHLVQDMATSVVKGGVLEWGYFKLCIVTLVLSMLGQKSWTMYALQTVLSVKCSLSILNFNSSHT